MSTIYLILLMLVFTYAILWFCTFHTLNHKYQFYKITYNALKNRDYNLSHNDSEFIRFSTTEKSYRDYISVCSITGVINFAEIQYFKKCGSIKLVDGYIHNNFMLAFDIYSLYWYQKIKKQIILSSRSLDEIRDDKLKQLLG